MEAKTILTANILDILFEGRNKAYGAYTLRKGYRRRLNIAMCSLFGLLTLLCAAHFLANRFAPDPGIAIVHPDTQLTEIIPPSKSEEPIPPPRLPDPPKIRTIQSTTPRIVRDEDVREDEKPPEVEELDEARIGLTNQDGVEDIDITAPPLNEGKGIIVAPRKDEPDDEKTFMIVEIESAYPGGMAAWIRYLTKTLKYPQDAQEKEVQGHVLVQFIVDKIGVVSEVEAISGPVELREEAVRVIKKSGKWTPAIQNGRTVKSYKKQPIGFELHTN